MNDLARSRQDEVLLDQRRRFCDGLAAWRPNILANLEAWPAARLLAALAELAGSIPAGGLLVLAERAQDGTGDPVLRAALGRRFAHVATLQQRPVDGSMIAGARQAGSRLLPLTEALLAAPVCLLHLASDADLPSPGALFFESDGTARPAPAWAGARPAAAADPMSWAPAPLPQTADLDARRRAVALIERLAETRAGMFDQAEEIARLQRQLAETPVPGRTFFDIPRTRHAWPLAADRHAARGLYDTRVDDAALAEADAGTAFLARHGLLGDAPDHAGAVEALAALPYAALGGPPDVSIVIPVHGQLAYTLNCLDSLFRQTGRHRAETIVVDDASPDRTAAVLGPLVARLPAITLLRQRRNRGFIASCNAGAARARGRFVLFLNNDTRVVPGWLDALADSFALFPKAGLVGSKMLYPDGTLQEAGGIIWRDGSCWNDGRHDDPNRPHYAYARQVDYVSGCSIMLPRALFEELGGFDPRYAPAYCEDADLALRVREAGREVWFQPQSRVIHYEGRTAGTDTAQGVKAHQIANGHRLFLRWRHRLEGHRANGDAPFLERERHITRRALIVDATTPTPRQDAGSVTTAMTLRLFQNLGYKAHFLPQDNFLYQPEHTPALLQAGIEVAYAPYEAGVDATLRRYGWSYDVVLVYRVTVLEHVLDALRRFAPQAPVLFHTMDLHFLRMERAAAISGDAQALAEAAAMRRRELELIGRVDCTITHSTYEQALLQAAVPQAPIVVWPFMFPFHGTTAGFAARRDICFLGGYRHAPNVDAVVFFVREVLPLVRRHEPGVRFIIAGANPTAEVEALACEDVVVTGAVEDLRHVFDRCRVFACSLRIGAGTKGKVSTAMSYGLPVVSTSCGAEGMDLRHGEDVLLADGAADFADACLRLYRDPALWRRLSEAGQALVREKHSPEMGLRVLDGAIETALTHKLGLDQRPDQRPD